MLFTQKMRHSLKYHLVRDEPPCTVKTIDWEHQTGPRKGAYIYSILLCVTHMLCVSQVCHAVSHCRCQSLCKRWELFFVKPGVKVNGQY